MDKPDKIFVVVKTQPWSAADRWICGMSDPDQYGIIRATPDDDKAEDAAIQAMRYEISLLEKSQTDFPAHLRLPEGRTPWTMIETLYRAALKEYAAEMAGIFVIEVELDMDELTQWLSPDAPLTIDLEVAT